VLRNYDSYNVKNTRYRFDRVVRVDILFDQNNPLRGGNWIQLPSFSISKKCCINVKNVKTNKFKCVKKEDLRCFEYALGSIINPIQKNGDRPTHYNITRYEKYENFLNKSINIYKYDDIKITLYYQSQKLNNKEGHINLLLYKDHVVGIKNLSALLRGQIHRYTNH
ncbi:MAG: hypothetical protein H9Q67_07200, partial [Spiroplasma ixodetis]|nr:hypothetical protein [Spiroplasma ixodetis]